MPQSSTVRKRFGGEKIKNVMVIVGDNLRTDILAGFQAGLETILVLSGVSSLDDIDSMPFRPSWIYPSVAEIDVI